MGDRCNVTIVVKACDVESNPDLCAFLLENEYDRQKNDKGVELVMLVFYDVNYSNTKMEHVLNSLQINYDKYWTSGIEYVSGSECYRKVGEEFKMFPQSGCTNMVDFDSVLKAYVSGNMEEYIQQYVESKSIPDI